MRERSSPGRQGANAVEVGPDAAQRLLSRWCTLASAGLGVLDVRFEVFGGGLLEAVAGILGRSGEVEEVPYGDAGVAQGFAPAVVGVGPGGGEDGGMRWENAGRRKYSTVLALPFQGVC